MNALHLQSLSELSRRLHAGEFTSVELAKHFLGRIDADNDRLNAFITVCPERALDEARAADARFAAGKAGPLNGLPLAHKDIFCSAGLRTSCGSRMLDNFISPYDATVVERLREAGMVTLGKTNMDEFAMGSSNESSWYGAVRNPWDVSRTPGGSSGGSAAAVAARLVPVATGTDTGGSIRQPASLSGITGIKPTYGRVSRFGMVAFASSLDQAGVLAASAEDAALVLQAMAGFDARDSTSVERDVPDYAAALNGDVGGLRIGVPRDYFDDGLDPEVGAAVRKAIAQFEEMGASVREVRLPSIGLAVPAYYVVAPAECSSNLSRFDGVRFGHRCESPESLADLYTRSRAEGFGDEVKRRILTGTYVLSSGYYDAYYLKAQKARRLIANEFDSAFEEVDLIMGPTAPDVAFPLGEKVDDPVSMYLNDIYTVSANLAGLPGMSVPCGLVRGLPVGLQLIGPHFSEERLLNAAHAYQLASEHHRDLAPGAGDDA